MRRLLGRPLSARASDSANLLTTFGGRLFLISTTLWLIVLAVQSVTVLPVLADIFRKIVSLASILSGLWLGGVLARRSWTAFMWRVRRKLILSYLLLGLLPVVLGGVFALASGVVIYRYFAAYMFRAGFDHVSDDVRQIVESSVTELQRTPDAAQQMLDRRYANLKEMYSGLSLAVLRVAPGGGPVAHAGAWRHEAPPTVVPEWVVSGHHFAGVIAPPVEGPAGDERLVIRVAATTNDGRFVVLADLPVDTDVIASLDDRTSTRIDYVTPCLPREAVTTLGQTGLAATFSQTVISVNCTYWSAGGTGHMAVRLHAPLLHLYARLAGVESTQVLTAPGGPLEGLLLVLMFFGVLLLLVQGSALFFGILLGRQITSAVHELFIGTERVRARDFTHRIKIDSRDQLGELGDAFNMMNAETVHYMHMERDKQRIDDELRIARDIQKSLLPAEAPQVPGLCVSALWEPALEMCGDYYDFFLLGPRQLGVLVADVSGKGTSAALYMAELKGIILALSHAERSPRKLLVDVNRLLSGHLSNRYFITMTYAVVDLDAMTLTCARAGHTPLILVSGRESQVLVPDGMVVGLHLPGATERFESLLTEYTTPIAKGDVIVLYTDGVTEAMDPAGELFGDAALARVLSANSGLDSAGIRERVVREVEAFVGDAAPSDDMIMVVLKVTGEMQA